jgi:hypothetical protein
MIGAETYRAVSKAARDISPRQSRATGVRPSQPLPPLANVRRAPRHEVVSDGSLRPLEIGADYRGRASDTDFLGHLAVIETLSLSDSKARSWTRAVMLEDTGSPQRRLAEAGDGAGGVGRDDEIRRIRG